LFKTIFEGIIQPQLLTTLLLLISEKKESLILPIFRRFLQLTQSSKVSLNHGIVFSVLPLTSSQMEILTSQLQKQHPNITLINEIDPTLIGGIKIQIDDAIIDDSLQGKIQKLKIFGKNIK
jgi:F-type H+-transporting ATPase subunit delta